MAKIYKTAGRQRLLNFLQNSPDRQFGVEELTDELNRLSREEGVKQSKSTLYRHLSELCAEGSVRKYRSDTQSAYVYQYVGQGDCRHHFHLKCEACGRLIHLECAVSEELLSHISSHHQFCVDSGRSILYGLCADCVDRHAPKNSTPCGGICPCGHNHT